MKPSPRRNWRWRPSCVCSPTKQPDYLMDGNVSGAQGIIVEVLANRDSPAARSASAINVFQEVRAADARLAVLSGHDGAVMSAAFSPDGRRIVTASGDQTARIWDAATATPLAVLSGHERCVVYRGVLARRAAHRHRLP